MVGTTMVLFSTYCDSTAAVKYSTITVCRREGTHALLYLVRINYAIVVPYTVKLLGKD